MADDVVICTICGAKNDPQSTRCTSCGAKLDPIGAAELSAEEQHARRYQQDSFAWKWVGISFGIYMTLQGIALVLLPAVIDAYEPQGLAALMISALIWFFGGILVGWLSPGKTFLEPSVGAMTAVIPTLFWIDKISDVYPLSLLAMIVGGMLGVMITLLGGFLGEKIQMSTRGHS